MGYIFACTCTYKYIPVITLPCPYLWAYVLTVRRMREEDLGACSIQEYHHWITPVHKWAIMVQPVGVPVPEVGSFAVDGLSQSAHEPSIKFTIQTHFCQHKLCQNHAHSVPEDDQHDFLGPLASSCLAGAFLIVLQPCCCRLLRCWVINREERLIPCHDVGPKGRAPSHHAKDPNGDIHMPLLLLVSEVVCNPFRWAFLQLQVRAQSMMDCG